MRILKQEKRPYKPICDIFRNPERTFLRINLELGKVVEEREIDRLKHLLKRWAELCDFGELAEPFDDGDYT